MKRSILQPDIPYKGRISFDSECLYCGRPAQCRHHIYCGPNRTVSDNEGFWVYLCHEHHNMSPDCVHFNRDKDMELKRRCQALYELDHTREDFMKLIGRSYL